MNASAVAAWMQAVPAEGPDAARAAAKAADLGQLLGPLPEWDLSDLYAGLDDPTFSTDITRAEEECRQFRETYAGRIADLAAGPDASERLAEAIATYERIEVTTWEDMKWKLREKYVSPNYWQKIYDQLSRLV